ncbi:oligopeptide/dipeptide ABC transporter ATP-binding protein [Massilia forsythiae]|nr:ABC transporter ATP-binding protein [Massilia forsythiae]
MAAWLGRAQAVAPPALDGVSLSIHAGEAVGLVGESGSGKSTLARVAIGMLQASSGSRTWKGLALQPGQMRPLGMQMIFQDTHASLNPRMRVLDLIGEAALAHRLALPANRRAFVEQYLDAVGLPRAAISAYPHQLSGGQRARVAIARALALGPDLLICDEAVAALDVSVQAQILNLFQGLRRQLGLGYFFISHDVRVVRHLCDRVLIMYRGRVVETGSVALLIEHGRHPYTQLLLDSLPERIATRSGTANPAIAGVAEASREGCAFAPRCRHAHARCLEQVPALREIAPTHFSACHLDQP